MFLSSPYYITKNRLSISRVLTMLAAGLAKLKTTYYDQLERSPGSSFWTVGWLLYAISLNLTRINMNPCYACSPAG